ncbi:MAG: twin-arginine translocase TatA/TatE family subunit [Parachlamydiaceae bacterium]
MFGTGELIVILLVVLVLFGGKKLPELARSIGLGIREFKKACHGVDDEEVFSKHNAEKESVKKRDAETAIIEVEPENKDRH